MKILLAIDDSAYSKEATNSLAKQFRSSDSEVRVLNVVEPVRMYISADAFPHFTPQVEEIEEDRQMQTTDLVNKVAKDLRDMGFKATGVVGYGDPKTQIIENATEWGADMIVLGSHGWKGMNRFLLGSVSEAVARHAHCSVEIVRMPPNNTPSQG